MCRKEGESSYFFALKMGDTVYPGSSSLPVFMVVSAGWLEECLSHPWAIANSPGVHCLPEP